MKLKTKEIVEQIKGLLEQRTTCKEISRRLNVSLGTIYKYREKNFYSEIKRSIITEELKNKIIETYLENYSSQKTANIVGVSASYVYKFLKKEHNELLKKNNSIATGKPRRKWKFNEHYFDEINAPNKAYILGFLYADGYNYEKDGGLKIGIWNKDVEILDFISKELELKRPYEKCKGQVLRLLAHSKYMSSILKKWGCGQAKTFKLVYPDFLDKELHSSFIRGYFDGDGCIYYLKHQATARLSYSGYIPFLESINKNLMEQIGTTNRKVYPINSNKGTGSLEYTRRDDIEKIERFMYGNSEFSLKRKQDKVQGFLSKPQKQKIIDNEVIVSVYKEKQSITKVAKELEIGVMTVYERLMKYQPDILVRNKYRINA